MINSLLSKAKAKLGLSPKKIADTSPLPWVAQAMKHFGQKEIKGSKHNPVIVDFWKVGHAGPYKDDETAWCAAFISAVIELSGYTSARTGWARGYLKWGHTLPGPAIGAIVVFERGPTSGHVGIVVGRDRLGYLMVLGGNQKDSVRIDPFSVSRVLGYRWPTGHDFPKATGMASLPIIASDGKLSTNEA